MSEQPPIIVSGLHKTYHVGFFRKRVDAVRGIDFSVRSGEIFGLLGPNGAGKTSTIKMLLGLVFPSAGTIRLFGEDNPNPSLRRRLGYLPESPYVYQYLRVPEFLDLCGQLCGIHSGERAKKTSEMIERVGLSHALDRPIGRFSKGMLQRVGLAQALLHDPELLILDEPMTGLDPIGRKAVRDLIAEEKARGKTILFTSHILSDVERLCDRVVILKSGRVTAHGTLNELLQPEVQRTEIELANATDPLRARLAELPVTLRGVGANLQVTIRGESGVREIVELALAHEARIVALHEQRETLENLFLRDALP